MSAPVKPQAPSSRPTNVSPHYLQFLADHGPSFSQVVHVHSAFAGGAELSTDLVRALETIVRSGDGSVRLRAFRGFALDYQLTNHLAALAPAGAADAATWLQRGGGPTACVAINELAQWDIELGDWYISRVNEIENVGRHLAVEILDTYTFISGGEGWTPFGIHVDYEPSFIYHLGPGEKVAWVWPEGQPQGAVVTRSPALNGVSFAIDEHLGQAMQYVLEPGDFLCIPAGLYHVFRNTAPSAFLGITVFPNSVRRLTDDLLTGLVPHCADRLDGLEEVRQAVRSTATDLETRMTDLPSRLDRELRRLKSCGATIAPHRTVLSQLSPPDPCRPYSARFNGVCQAADENSIFANGRATLSGLRHVDVHRLCSVLNLLDGAFANDIAQHLDCDAADVTALLDRLTRLGALRQ